MRIFNELRYPSSNLSEIFTQRMFQASFEKIWKIFFELLRGQAWSYGRTDRQTDRRTALDVLVYILLSVGLWAARCRERARDDHLRRSAFWQTCLCGVHENSVMSELQPTLLMTVNVLVYICYLYAMGCKLYRACMWLPLRCSSSWQTSLCCVSEFEYWLR